MEYSYYRAQLPELESLSDKSFSARVSFLQHVLLSSSGVLALLISLHSGNLHGPHIRLVFLLSVLFLALGILCSAISLYGYTVHLSSLYELFRVELQTALKEDRELQIVSMPMKRTTLFFEKVAYILLSISLAGIILYAGLASFPQF